MQAALHHHGFVGRIGKLHYAFGVVRLGSRYRQLTAIGNQVMRILNHVVAKSLLAQRSSGQFLLERQLQRALKQCLVGIPQALAERQDESPL